MCHSQSQLSCMRPTSRMWPASNSLPVIRQVYHFQCKETLFLFRYADTKRLALWGYFNIACRKVQSVLPNKGGTGIDENPFRLFFSLESAMANHKKASLKEVKYCVENKKDESSLFVFFSFCIFYFLLIRLSHRKG